MATRSRRRGRAAPKGVSAGDRAVVERFKRLLIEREVPVVQVILFGSRARGDSDEESDFDVLVLVDWITPEIRRLISHYAWELGYELGIVIQTIAMTRYEAEETPQRSSLFMQAVHQEGVSI